jgi:CheY-like chemotaxis protein
MKKVLLIEDDMVVRENTAELLELANYSVITANNGKDGISLAKKHLPNIIICDIMMPELNGYGVLQILSKDPITKHIPFIFLTAKTEHKDIRKGMDLGADDYITKPYDESELFSAIESRLAKVAILSDQSNTILLNKIDTPTDIKDLNQLKNFFADNSEEIFYKAGEEIYLEGDNSNYSFLIDKGIVKTYKIDEQGKELITGLHNEDDFFGFTSFLHNVPYQESATAIENTQVYRFSKAELKQLLEQNPEATMQLVDYLTENVSEIKAHLLEMAYSSVRKKTANTILQFTKKMKQYNENEQLKISRSDLASIAGIATETFIRTLSEFKKDGIIDIDGRNIKILDIEKLKKVF